MINIHDHTGKLVTIPYPPKRIVSLVPSQTELLHYLGLEEQVVGITKFCIYPDSWSRSKKRVGGTKNINFELIRSLSPDLVIANKEENDKMQIEALEKITSVFTTHVFDLSSAKKMIHDIGLITQTEGISYQLIQSIDDKFATLNFPPLLHALYLIWREPYMAAGGDTFINEMMKYAGLLNCISYKDRYPELSINDIIRLHPDIILLSSEPYPFKEIHLQEIKSFMPDTRTLLVNGEYFSWYGSRLLETPSYFKRIHIL